MEVGGPKALFLSGVAQQGAAKDDTDVRAPEGADAASEGAPRGLEALLDTLQRIARGSTGQALVDAVDGSFDLLDDETRQVLAVRATAEKSGQGGERARGAMALVAAITVATQKRMEKAGERLRGLLAAAKGDAKALQLMVASLRRNGLIDRAFMDVVDANIDAAQRSGQSVKLQVLKFLKQALSSDGTETARGGEGAAGAAGAPEDVLARHHAPHVARSGAGADAGEGELEVTAPEDFGSGRGVFAEISEGKAKNGRQKHQLRARIDTWVAPVAQHLEEHGWAASDGILSLDGVRAVRAEIAALESYYKQSEIWVGKEAGLGAQIVAPDVRGDRVMWMCGGHGRAAGVVDTRAVATRGDIEPCDASVKRRAAKKAAAVSFGALKALVRAVDALVLGQLKGRVARLAGAHERSDAMLAVYPGGGARFQRHVDNTAQDGRVLTVVVYLNPAWDRAHGGALRVTHEGGARATDVYPEAGRVALFFSDRIMHEVRPCHAHRHAVTIWYYDRAERAAAVAKAEGHGGLSALAIAGGDARQLRAKAFMEGVARGGWDAERVRAEAAALEDEAAGIVGGILGLGGVAEVRAAFEGLSQGGVEDLRQGLAAMGLR
ncbi:unnamed protein product [Pedinophyceae sp. YPF-701]|nr:unnamed protein product [Pedinophyceae sp. YPF-701]